MPEFPSVLFVIPKALLVVVDVSDTEELRVVPNPVFKRNAHELLVPKDKPKLLLLFNVKPSVLPLP